MSSYQPNIPTGTVNLDIDYQNLRANFQQIDTTYSVDHVPLTDNGSTNGFHKAVHLVKQAAPAAIPGVGSVYCTEINDTYSNDETFYLQTGGGKIMQMTRNFVPVAAAKGTTFLPGGLVLQWGTLTAVANVVTAVAFVADLGVKNFTVNCFNVQTTLNGNTSTEANLNISLLTATGFTYINTSTNSRTFFWMAIGY